MSDWNEDNVPDGVLEGMREDYQREQKEMQEADWVDNYPLDYLKDMYETILEHEEQGCNATEVASFVNLNVQQVERVKEMWVESQT